MKFIGNYIKGIEIEKVKKILDKYKQKDIKQKNMFSIMIKDIFPFLLKNNITPIIISGSQQEIIDLYKDDLGFIKAYAVQFEIIDGKYTDKCILNTGMSKNKQKIIDKIILENPESIIMFGFGDSTSDIPILKSAKYSFVNNKNKFLNEKDIHYFDFNNLKSGKKILKIMEKSIKQQKINYN